MSAMQVIRISKSNAQVVAPRGGRMACRAKTSPVPSVQAFERALSRPSAAPAAIDTAVVVAVPASVAAPSLAERALASPPVAAYLRALQSNPLGTKQWTSCSGFVIGDILAQALTEPHYTLSRTLILGIYGWLVDAPAGHVFYDWLDANIEVGNAKSAAAVGKKIAIDQLMYAPIFTCVLFTYLSLAHGDVAGIPVALQERVVPTLMANYAVWPLAHALNFYFVPTEQRILYNNFIAIMWTTWLSCLAH